MPVKNFSRLLRIWALLEFNLSTRKDPKTTQKFAKSTCFDCKILIETSGVRRGGCYGCPVSGNR